MSNAALAFLAGLGGGYFSAKDKELERQRQEKADQRAQEDHDARMEEANQKKREREALAAAGKPLTVDNGATVTGVSANPTVYDNADVASSDVRQANRLAELPQPAAAAGMPAPAPASATPTPVVGGKPYADAGSAQAAATAGSTPEAIRARQIAALRTLNPERADQMEAAGKNAALTDIKLKEATAAEADAAWRRKVSAAMLDGGHEGLARLVSESEHGPMAGVTLKAIPSADGKTVTYAKVDADGKVTPTGLTFTNDGDGIARAAAALDRAVSPADRVKMLQADAKEKREALKDAALAKEAEAKGRYYDAAAGAQGAKADATANGGGKPFRLDEDDKLRLQEASKGVTEATKAYGEALKVLMPGQKPEESPAVQFAAQQLKTAKLNHLRTNIELGQVSPQAMANQILGAAKDTQGVLASLSDLAGLDGDFSEKVAAVVTSSEAWKRMAGGKSAAAPQSKAGKAIASAPPGAAVLQPDGSYAPPGARTKSKVPVMTEAPAVTAGGLPRDPEARAGKLRTKVAAEAGMEVPPAQALQAAQAASAAAKTAADAYKVVDMPGFQLLPKAEQLRIAELTKGK